MSGLKIRAGKTAFRYNPKMSAGETNTVGSTDEAKAAYKTTLAQLQNSQKVDAALESGSAPTNLDKAETQGSDWLLAGALEGLKSSKKYEGQKRGFWASKKNSAEYTNIQNYLSQILQSMNSGFSENGSDNKKLLRDIVINYQQLDDACNVYLKKKGGQTGAGKARKDQVKMIQELIEADRVHLQYLAFDAGEEELSALRGQTWGQVLDYASAGKIEVDNLSEKQKFGTGVKQGENAGRILDEGMFSKEEIHEGIEMIDNHLGCNAFSNYNYDENGKKIDAGLNKYTSIKMSNRNVAMSRIANLLGIGDVIEQSKTVTIHDKATGKNVRGNLMTKAKGKEMQKELIDQRNINVKETDVLKRTENAKNQIAPSMQKELSSLQVLDYICGQGDRHVGNYFTETEKDSSGKAMFTHIHGIDNDNAFSTGVDLEQEIKKRKNAFSQLAMVVDSKDNLVLAHIDEKLADNILNLDDKEIEIVLKDLIEPDFIPYTVQRFKKVKAAVQKEMTKGDDSKIVKNGEWNEKTHDDFMKNTRFFKEVILPLQKAGVSGDDAQFYKVLNKVSTEDANDVYEALKNDSYYSSFVLKLMAADFITSLGEIRFKKEIGSSDFVK